VLRASHGLPRWSRAGATLAPEQLKRYGARAEDAGFARFCRRRRVAVADANNVRVAERVTVGLADGITDAVALANVDTFALLVANGDADAFADARARANLRFMPGPGRRP